MKRRSFLGAVLAAAAAPAIVRASSLMPVAPRIWTPPAWGEGVVGRMALVQQEINDHAADALAYMVLVHPDWMAELAGMGITNKMLGADIVQMRTIPYSRILRH
jgi:hypothetical protein